MFTSYLFHWFMCFINKCKYSRPIVLSFMIPITKTRREENYYTWWAEETNHHVHVNKSKILKIVHKL